MAKNKGYKNLSPCTFTPAMQLIKLIFKNINTGNTYKLACQIIYWRASDNILERI
jgi:hypothetical protein